MSCMLRSVPARSQQGIATNNSAVLLIEGETAIREDYSLVARGNGPIFMLEIPQGVQLSLLNAG